jgi:regulator of protease activity HflC (stomatin/prohibitin superfamily)
VEAVVIGLVVVIVLLGVLAWKSTVKVPQEQAAVIERGGKFKTVAEHGMYFTLPFVDKVRARVDLREQVLAFRPQTVDTSDGGTVSVQLTLYFEVADPKAAVYEPPGHIAAVEQHTKDALREAGGTMTRAQALSSPEPVERYLGWKLEQEIGRWGVRVNRVSATVE